MLVNYLEPHDHICFCTAFAVSHSLVDRCIIVYLIWGSLNELGIELLVLSYLRMENQQRTELGVVRSLLT